MHDRQRWAQHIHAWAESMRGCMGEGSGARRQWCERVAGARAHNNGGARRRLQVWVCAREGGAAGRTRSARGRGRTHDMSHLSYPMS